MNLTPEDSTAWPIACAVQARGNSVTPNRSRYSVGVSDSYRDDFRLGEDLGDALIERTDYSQNEMRI